MSKEKPESPSKDGLERARRRLKGLRKKDPSPELIKIIDEVTHMPKPNQERKRSEDDIAAKESPKRDLDL